MGKGYIRRRFLAFGVILVVLSAGCPNNLLDTIEEEVEVIVTPPSIESLFPSSGAANVNIDIDNIYITFTKGIDSDSVNSDNLIVRNTANTSDPSDDTAVQGTYSVSNRTLNFNPSTELKYMTTYTVTVTRGIMDVDGNNFTGEYTWEFTTKSTPSAVLPTVSDFRLDYGRTATNQDRIRVDIQGTNGTGETGDLEYRYRLSTEDWPGWTLLADNAVALTDISLPLSGVSSETFNFEAEVRNESGYVSDLATASIQYDEDAPTVISTSPEANSSDYPSNSGVISLSFSETIDPNSITISTYDIDGGIESEGNFYLMEGDTRIEGSDLRYIETDPNGIYPDNTILLTGLELDQGVDYMVFLESSAADVAGNPMAGEYSWFFRTGDAIDNEPPVGTVLLDTQNYGSVHPTATATNTPVLNLKIEASDSYNDIYGIKIWGYNDGTLPLFEGDALWEPYYDAGGDPYGSNGNPYPWTLPSGDGFKYIYYKFMDTNSNETAEPQRLKISLDTTAPAINSVSLDGNAVYTNSQLYEVELTVDAADTTSGISRMRISVDGALDTEPEIDWIPTQTITLPSGDGVKTVEIEVIDNVDLAVTDSDTIILDTIKPVIVFDLEDQLVINASAAQTGTYTDANPIAAYLWEQVSGPGVLSFSDAAVETPTVSADGEGEYILKVTVTDAAGNESFGTVPLVWDVTAPGNPAGTAGNGPAPAVSLSPYYSATNQPEWSWDSVSDADYYKVSFAASPDWDTPDSTGQTGYISTGITGFSPAEALSEGLKTLQVRAYDRAGNHTETGSAPVFIDTVFPVIDNDGAFYTVNSLFSIDNSSAATDQGTGIETRLWEQQSGAGAMAFGSPTALSTTVSADTDATYTFSLTVTDFAGNDTIAYYTLEWDTTPPSDPALTGLTHTPSTSPSWSWNTGGGGNGTYRYRLDRIGRDWQSNGGDYSGSSETVFDWQAETGNTLYTGGSLEDKYEYTLSVQERDEAGNWSAESSHAIWIDTDYTSEPNLIREGDYLRNVSSVTWSWESGAGFDGGSDYFRYSLDGSAWTETGANTITYSSLSDDTYTFQIEERVNSSWTGKIASSSVQIDTVAPGTPSVAMTQTGTSTTETNDTTPTLTWNTGGGGVGLYMYRFYNGSAWGSWSDETTATSYTHTTALGDGVSAALEVRERDLAGNWSVAGSKSITVDTTLPVPSTIIINAGATYATSTSVSLAVSATGASQMQFTTYSSLYGWGTWSSWETYSTGKSFSLTSGDETKYALVKFRDAAGNVSGYIYDTIVLDTTPPSVSSFYINSNATSSGSTSVTLNSSVTGASTMYLHNGVSGGYSAYSYSDSRSWTLTSGYGLKAVQVYFADAAGNTTSVSTDYIHYGNTTLYNSTKGETSNGYFYLYYDSYATENGTNYYRAYFHTAPTSTPSVSPAAVGQSTSLSPYYYSGNLLSGSLSEGTVYYVYIGMYNTVAGLSDRFSNYMISFSSDITVVYNSSDTTDTSLASQIKSLFENESLTTTYSTYISGSEPVWTVTMLPQNLITNSWTTTDDRYIIYGDPVIITPRAYLTYSTPNIARNIAHRSYNTGLSPTTTNYKSAVIAMGYSGARFLQLLENNPSWHYSGSLSYQTQYPTEIGAGHVMYTTSEDKTMLQWTASTNVWNYPLASTIFNGGTTPVHGASTQLSYTALGGSASSYEYRAMVYRSSDTNPTNGYLLCGDSAYAHYFPVVQQGRFLQYGFPVLADRPYTGKVLFKNLVYRMYAGFY